MNSTPATPNTYPYSNERIWSRSEKAIARKIFEAALKRELQDVMERAKQMAKEIKDPENLWGLERFLSQRRKNIDRNYEFRTSRLTQVLGILLCEGRVSEQELRGLREDRMRAIRSCANALSSDEA